MTKTSALLLLINIAFVSFPQTNTERTLHSLGSGLNESVSWYDLPAAGLFISSSYFPLKLEQKLHIGSFAFDEGVRQNLHVPGSNSLGSTDPRRYPEYVFLGRLVYTTAAGLIFGAETNESYKHTFVFMKTVLYNVAITELVKNVAHRDRPDQSDDRSFFSGHTSTAFVTSTFLYNEISTLIDKSDTDKMLRTVLKAGSFSALYGWAAYVGYSRMRDGKHYLSDVLIGSAAGTIIGTYFYNHYFDEDPGLLDNISLGYQNNQPVISLYLNF